MAEFNIPEPFQIPFFDHDEKSLVNTIKNSSKRRKMSPLYFAFRKVKNIILYRLAFFCPLNSWRVKFHRWRGVHIGKGVYIGTQCSIDNAYPELVYIEDNVGVNQGSLLLAHTNVNSWFDGVVECKAAPIHIKHNALISVNTTILPGVTIGEFAITSAGSVVMSDVAPYTLVIGNPAKKITNFEKIINNTNE